MADDERQQLEAQALDQHRLGLLILENKDGAALASAVPHLRAAADLWARLEWPARRAEVLMDLGRLHAKAGEVADAAAAYDEALSLFDGLGDVRACDAAAGAGEAHLRLGRAQVALAVQRRASALAERLNDHLRMAETAYQRARAHVALGQGDDALAVLQRAHRQFAAFRKGQEVARCRELEGEAHALHGDGAAMAEAYGDAVRILEVELGRPEQAGEVLLRWAERERLADHLDQALEVLGRALAQQERLGGKAAQATIQRRIGQVQQRRGDAAAAEAAFRRALEIGTAIGDQDGISRTQLLLGQLALAQGREGEGFELLRRSAETAAARGNLVHQEQALAATARELRQRGRADEALAAMQRWVEVLKQLGDRDDALAVLGEIAAVHQERGAVADAEIHLRRLIQVCSLPADRAVRVKARFRLGALLTRGDHHPEAVELLRQALAEADPAAEPELCTQIHWQLGQSALLRHDPAAAVLHFGEADALLRNRADDRMQIKVLVGIGNALVQQGNDADAKIAFEGAARLCEQRGDLTRTMAIRRAAGSL